MSKARTIKPHKKIPPLKQKERANDKKSHKKAAVRPQHCCSPYSGLHASTGRKISRRNAAVAANHKQVLHRDDRFVKKRSH